MELLREPAVHFQLVVIEIGMLAKLAYNDRHAIRVIRVIRGEKFLWSYLLPLGQLLDCHIQPLISEQLLQALVYLLDLITFLRHLIVVRVSRPQSNLAIIGYLKSY